MTNELITVIISKTTGRITEVQKNGYLNPDSDVNYVGEKGIGYNFYCDEKTQFDAWNIDPNYHSKPIAFPFVDTIIIEEDGPIRSTLLIKYLPTAAHSTIHTRISLYINDPKIFGESIIDWQEEWKILKIGVDTIFDSETITCGIPFGCQQRSTKPKTVLARSAN